MFSSWYQLQARIVVVFVFCVFVGREEVGFCLFVVVFVMLFFGGGRGVLGEAFCLFLVGGVFIIII